MLVLGKAAFIKQKNRLIFLKKLSYVVDRTLKSNYQLTLKKPKDMCNYAVRE